VGALAAGLLVVVPPPLHEIKTKLQIVKAITEMYFISISFDLKRKVKLTADAD
jgi:hypothetical protein